MGVMEKSNATGPRLGDFIEVRPDGMLVARFGVESVECGSIFTAHAWLNRQLSELGRDMLDIWEAQQWSWEMAGFKGVMGVVS